MSDRRYNAKLILPDGTEKPSLIVYFPPTLTGEEVEAIGRKILAVFTGRVLSDVEDEEGRGTTTEDMLDAGLLDADGVPASDDAHPIWPIAKLTIKDGLCVRAGLYAPGLPDGEHNVYPLPVNADAVPAGVRVDGITSNG
jgi:hypothetical protein